MLYENVIITIILGPFTVSEARGHSIVATKGTALVAGIDNDHINLVGEVIRVIGVGAGGCF